MRSLYIDNMASLGLDRQGCEDDVDRMLGKLAEHGIRASRDDAVDGFVHLGFVYLGLCISVWRPSRIDLLQFVPESNLAPGAQFN